MRKIVEAMAAILEIAAVYLFYYAARLYHRLGFHHEEDRIRSMMKVGQTIHQMNIEAHQQQVRAEKAPLN